MRTRIPAVATMGNSVDSDKDQRYKQKMSQSRNGVRHKISVGDRVLVKQAKNDKLTPRYKPEPLIVVEIKGSSVIASDGQSTIMRDGSQFKKIEIEEEEDDETEVEAEATEQGEDEPSDGEEEPSVEQPHQGAGGEQEAAERRPSRTTKKPGWLKDYVLE